MLSGVSGRSVIVLKQILNVLQLHNDGLGNSVKNRITIWLTEGKITDIRLRLPQTVCSPKRSRKAGSRYWQSCIKSRRRLQSAVGKRNISRRRKMIWSGNGSRRKRVWHFFRYIGLKVTCCISHMRCICRLGIW